MEKNIYSGRKYIHFKMSGIIHLTLFSLRRKYSDLGKWENFYFFLYIHQYCVFIFYSEYYIYIHLYKDTYGFYISISTYIAAEEHRDKLSPTKSPASFINIGEKNVSTLENNLQLLMVFLKID